MCIFFLFFCNSENKKKASVRLKCNGVQFKCNTVNSEKTKTTKTASSYSSTKKRPENSCVVFHALSECLFFRQTQCCFFFLQPCKFPCVWQASYLMPTGRSGIKRFLYVRKSRHEHIFAEIRLCLSIHGFKLRVLLRRQLNLLNFGKWSLQHLWSEASHSSKTMNWILHVRGILLIRKNNKVQIVWVFLLN